MANKRSSIIHQNSNSDLKTQIDPLERAHESQKNNPHSSEQLRMVEGSYKLSVSCTRIGRGSKQTYVLCSERLKGHLDMRFTQLAEEAPSPTLDRDELIKNRNEKESRYRQARCQLILRP